MANYSKFRVKITEHLSSISIIKNSSSPLPLSLYCFVTTSMLFSLECFIEVLSFLIHLLVSVDDRIQNLALSAWDLILQRFLQRVNVEKFQESKLWVLRSENIELFQRGPAQTH